jgi:hypothetical protein
MQQALAGRSLAGSAFTDDRQCLAATNREVDAVNRAYLATLARGWEDLPKLGYLQQGRAACRSAETRSAGVGLALAAASRLVL